ncbi:hypothetical protein D3C75_775060 [compost metagenome]
MGGRAASSTCTSTWADSPERFALSVATSLRPVSPLFWGVQLSCQGALLSSPTFWPFTKSSSLATSSLASVTLPVTVRARPRVTLAPAAGLAMLTLGASGATTAATLKLESASLSTFPSLSSARALRA